MLIPPKYTILEGKLTILMVKYIFVDSRPMIDKLMFNVYAVYTVYICILTSNTTFCNGYLVICHKNQKQKSFLSEYWYLWLIMINVSSN